MRRAEAVRFVRLQLEDGRRVYARVEAGSAMLLDAAPWRSGRETGERVELVSARRLCPVEPSKIVCVGRNYRAHAAELGNEVPSEPLLFFKPPSALLDPEGTVELPPPSLSRRVEHEVELAVVVGQPLRCADEATAAAAIFGYTVAGDVTARDLQRSDRLWTRGKGFDTFCPCGPAVVSGLDATALSVRCSVNGELRQDGHTARMVFSPPLLLAFISQVMTLNPGDLVLTGTPAGVGPLLDGDAVQMAIDPIGTLSFDVRASAAQ